MRAVGIGRIDGIVVADKALFPPTCVKQISEDLVRVPSVYLRGNLFRLADSSDSYWGEDRVSFVFASIPDAQNLSRSAPGADGVLVLVEDANQSKRYEDPIIAGADCYLRTPSVHLRYFAEGWMDRLLEFMRHFHMPALRYWNNGYLSGAGKYAGIDPNDKLAREKAWRKVLTGLLDAIENYLPKELDESLGLEIPAMREHLLRNGEIPLSWWTTPYERVPIEFGIADDLSARERAVVSLCLLFAHAEFEASARQSIRDAGKGLNLSHVPLRFNGTGLTLKSHFNAGDQILHVEVRPIRDGMLNHAVAEDEGLLASGPPSRIVSQNAISDGPRMLLRIVSFARRTTTPNPCIVSAGIETAAETRFRAYWVPALRPMKAGITNARAVMATPRVKPTGDALISATTIRTTTTRTAVAE